MVPTGTRLEDAVSLFVPCRKLGLNTLQIIDLAEELLITFHERGYSL
jgi:hypothetical protein